MLFKCTVVKSKSGDISPIGPYYQTAEQYCTVTQGPPCTLAKKIEKDDRRLRYIYLTFSMDVSQPIQVEEDDRGLCDLFPIFSYGRTPDKACSLYGRTPDKQVEEDDRLLSALYLTLSMDL